MVTPASFKSNILNDVSRYPSPQAIQVIDASSRDEAITSFADGLPSSSSLKDKGEFHQAVLEKERVVPIEVGGAISDAKLYIYDDFFIAMGLLKKGINRNSVDQVQVNMELIDDDVEEPLYATDGASGADVRAHIKENVVLNPGKSVLIPTGLKFEIPPGYEIQVRPRSGLALKHQITVLNAPSTIDSDYRGELKALLINHGQDDFVIEPKMRIAQIIFARTTQAVFNKQEKITANTQRGEGGFGHTGMF